MWFFTYILLLIRKNQNFKTVSNIFIRTRLQAGCQAVHLSFSFSVIRPCHCQYYAQGKPAPQWHFSCRGFTIGQEPVGSLAFENGNNPLNSVNGDC